MEQRTVHGAIAGKSRPAESSTAMIVGSGKGMPQAMLSHQRMTIWNVLCCISSDFAQTSKVAWRYHAATIFQSDMIPPLTALRCFEAAARHRSYTRAADELALTQSAVSKQVAQLEALIGTRLFRRTRHGVELTPVGAAYAKKVAHRLEGLERDTMDAKAQQGGTALQLATVPTFATRWLLPRLPGLRSQRPDLTVHLETRTRPFLFADTHFDAALYAGTPEQVERWPGTQATLLMHEDVVAVASPTLAATRKRWTAHDVAAAPLLQQSTRPESWRQWFRAMDAAPPQSMAGPRYELFSMLAMAAIHGLGIALMPRMLVEAELAQGLLVVLSPVPWRSDRNYYLVSPEAAREPAALGALRDWLLAEAGGG